MDLLAANESPLKPSQAVLAESTRPVRSLVANYAAWSDGSSAIAAAKAPIRLLAATGFRVA